MSTKEKVLEKKKINHDNSPVLNTKDANISIKKAELKSTDTDWRPVYTGIHSEIKLRHYSPRFDR